MTYRWSRKMVKFFFGVGALFALALALPPSAEADSFWCNQGALYRMDAYGDVYEMGTVYTEGNMTISCVGNRVKTVYRID